MSSSAQTRPLPGSPIATSWSRTATARSVPPLPISPDSTDRRPPGGGPIMRKPVAFEDIEEMRRLQGIEDVELREGIRQLGIGDFVKLTVLTGAKSCAGEIVLVRITS